MKFSLHAEPQYARWEIRHFRHFPLSCISRASIAWKTIRLVLSVAFCVYKETPSSHLYKGISFVLSLPLKFKLYRNFNLPPPHTHTPKQPKWM